MNTCTNRSFAHKEGWEVHVAEQVNIVSHKEFLCTISKAKFIELVTLHLTYRTHSNKRFQYLSQNSLESFAEYIELRLLPRLSGINYLEVGPAYQYF